MRYDVELASGFIFKVDIRDPWHHETLPTGGTATVTFPVGSTVAIVGEQWSLPRATPATLGFGLIWAFLIVFAIFPLVRIFYDAFTNETGQFTSANFLEFFTDL